jgi:TolB-like protein
VSGHSASTSQHSTGTDTFVARIAILGFAIFFLMQPAFSQGPAVDSLSARLSEIAIRSGRKTVAVVDFTDLQGCVTELGRYMAEDVSVALVNNAKGFEVIDRTNLKVLMQEHKLASTGIIDPATARQLGKVAGVDALITGTIAPLSDSVHVSAKVLDTETAKMLGGVTADIPRTRTVEELLTKGVANCGQTATGNPDDVQRSSGTTPAPKALATGQIGGIEISIRACRRDGDWVRCFGSVLNQNDVRKELTIHEGYMIDNLGGQSKPLRCQLGSHWGSAELEPGLPLNVVLSGTGLSDQATSVSLVLDVYFPRGEVTLRSIPIQAK